MFERPATATERGRLGLFDSVKALMATLVAIVHTRLELIVTELHEEIARVALLIMWGAVALFFAFLALTFLGFLVVIVFWDDHRVLAASLVAASFVLLALIAGIAASRQINAKPKPFTASLGELRKDYDELTS